MANLAKTIVATGASSGLGFEAIRQLLQQQQPYRVILGARNTKEAQAAYDELKFDAGKHSVTVLPLELSDLRGVRTFAHETLEKLGQSPVDFLMLNAAITNGADGAGPHGSQWCEPYIVNHLSQHYLMHLFREKLVSSQSRIIFVSSGAIRNVPDTNALDQDLRASSGASGRTVYSQTKFANLLAAHWWRRHLTGQCTIVAVSPGLIPGTGISRGGGVQLSMNMTDAKSVSEGAANILRAFTRDDLPDDPERIFLTSWGEWWPKDVYESSLDKSLQDKWCPTLEELEKQEGLSS